MPAFAGMTETGMAERSKPKIVYLTKVVREPKNVKEIDKYGRVVYNGLFNVTWSLQMPESVAGV